MDRRTLRAGQMTPPEAELFFYEVSLSFPCNASKSYTKKDSQHTWKEDIERDPMTFHTSLHIRTSHSQGHKSRTNVEITGMPA